MTTTMLDTNPFVLVYSLGFSKTVYSTMLSWTIHIFKLKLSFLIGLKISSEVILTAQNSVVKHLNFEKSGLALAESSILHCYSYSTLSLLVISWPSVRLIPSSSMAKVEISTIENLALVSNFALSRVKTAETVSVSPRS